MPGLSMLDPSVIASVLATLSFVYWLLRPKPLKGIPHNPVNSILGDIPELKRFIEEKHARPFDYFEHLVEKHGPVTQVLLGNTTIMILANREEVERILVRGKNVDTPPGLRALFVPIMQTCQISIPANDMWKRHRRIMGPSMHRRYLSCMTQHISAMANALVRLWDAKIDFANGHAFSAYPDIRLATMETISTTLGVLQLALTSIQNPSSTGLGAVEFPPHEIPPICQAFSTMIAGTHYGAQFPFPRLTIPIVLRFYPGWTQARNQVRSYLRDALDSSTKREKTATSTGSLVTDADCVVDIVTQQEHREGVEPFDREEAIDELCLYILAGQDTTAATLSWLVKYMPQNIDIQRKLHDEICSQLVDAESVTLETIEDVERMPLLEAVVVETLRCASVSSGVMRQIHTDEVIMGKHVPKGTSIVALLNALGKSESEWGPAAKEWRPNRWLRPDGSFNRNAGYGGNPFGLGHRSCFGQRLAVTQLKIFVVAMSRAFVFNPVPPALDSWEGGAELINIPKQCYVSLERWEC